MNWLGEIITGHELQAHLCGFTENELNGMGYTTSLHKNGTKQAGKIISILAIKNCALR